VLIDLIELLTQNFWRNRVACSRVKDSMRMTKRWRFSDYVLFEAWKSVRLQAYRRSNGSTSKPVHSIRNFILKYPHHLTKSQLFGSTLFSN